MNLDPISKVLSGQSMRPLGKLSTGKMKIQKISNMNIVWKYIEQVCARAPARMCMCVCVCVCFGVRNQEAGRNASAKVR